MIKVFKEMLDSDLSVIPVEVSSKAPKIKWNKYQKEKIKIEELRDVNKKTGIAVVCGQVSGGLECIDFDNHFGDAERIWNKYMKNPDVKKITEKYDLPTEATQSGGFHLFFRSKNPGGNTKLARRLNSKNKPETLIETRGEGGYVIVAPTSNYKILSGSFKKIPILEANEREILINAATQFEQYLDGSEYANHKKEMIESDRPGDHYDVFPGAIDEVKELLIDAGWRSKDGELWIRPDKDEKKGISATFGRVADNVFYVFSSNAHPFIQGRAYKPFQIYAILKHGGDWNAAAKDLNGRGFGSNSQYPNKKKIEKEVRDAIRKGFTLSPKEIEKLSDTLNIPMDIVADEVKLNEGRYKTEFGYDQMSPIEKAELYLRNNYKFRINMVTRMPEMTYQSGPWEDMNIDTVYRCIQKEKIPFSLEKLKSLLKSDFVEKYDPFEEYFNGLPVWDGVDYIGELCSYIKGSFDKEYFRTMLEKALVRNIACAIDPDYYNRMVFVLVGETKQEIGKTWFIRWLNPFGGEKYYTSEIIRDNKDSQFALAENFIYNMEELASISKYEIGKLKATISKTGVKDRLPYAAHKEFFPRRCSFWGSTNNKEFLNDDQNTRWIVFDVIEFDFNYSNNIDVKDIWTQAWALYNDPDYDFELTKHEREHRDTTNEDYRVVEFESSILAQNFIADSDAFMSNAEVLAAMNEATNGNLRLNTNATKLGRLLVQFGAERKKNGGVRGWGIKLGNPGPLREEDDLPF